MWTPNTHHKVPQPAGSQCADWYRRELPDASTILHALAHTKGRLDVAQSLLDEIRRDLLSVPGVYRDTPEGRAFMSRIEEALK